jgi:hypothetical protein
MGQQMCWMELVWMRFGAGWNLLFARVFLDWIGDLL